MLPSTVQERLLAWSRSLNVSPPGAHGWAVDGELPVRVSASLQVALGPWTSSFEAEDALELLDLLAAALFGRARVRVYSHGEEPAGHVLEIACGEGWVSAGGEAPRRKWFRAPQCAVLTNVRDAPESLRWGTPGALPSAPWVGMLAEAAPEAGELPIDGELDLHPFKPKEVRGVVEAYLDACVERGIHELRLVHGKGIGNLRRTVHALLDRHPAVVNYRLGGMGEGGWGATLVTLRTGAES